MPYRRSIAAVIVAVVTAFATFAIGMTMTNARIFDESHYPDWKGQWSRVPGAGIRGNPSWDPNKSEGRAQFSADGLLMPAKKDQAPPDLRYFEKK